MSYEIKNIAAHADSIIDEFQGGNYHAKPCAIARSTEPCVIARLINGITLNGYEFVLDNNGKIQKFSSKKAAEQFLLENNITDFNGLYFVDYKKLKQGTYEEIF
jgi:hypothetical protein